MAVNEKVGEIPTSDTNFRPGGWTPRLVGILLALVFTAELGYILFVYPLNAAALIGEAFGTNQVAWLQTAYALVAATAAAIIGKLADRYGKRKLIIVLLIMAAVGSFVGAAAPDFGIMMLGRVIQAPALCLPFLLPSLIRDIYPSKIVPFAASMSSGGAGVLSIFASLAVGIVLTSFGFRGAFWVPGVFALVLIVVVLTVVPESPVRSHSRIDWLGAVLLGAGVAGVLLGLSFGSLFGWTSLITLGSIVVGLILLVAWVFQAGKVPEPLLDLGELKQFPFAVTLIIAAIGFNGGSFFLVISPMIVLGRQPGWGLGLDLNGLAMIAAIQSLGNFIGALIVGRLLTRIAAPKVAAITMLTVTAFFIVALLGLQNSVVFTIAALLAGISAGASYALVYNLVILIVEPERQATSAAAATIGGNMGAAAIPVAVFAIMNSMMVVTGEGTPMVYATSAFVAAMIAGAATGVIGLAFAIALQVHQKRRGVEMLAGRKS